MAGPLMRGEQSKAQLCLSEQTSLVLDPKEPFPALLHLQHEQALKMKLRGEAGVQVIFSTS